MLIFALLCVLGEPLLLWEGCQVGTAEPDGGVKATNSVIASTTRWQQLAGPLTAPPGETQPGCIAWVGCGSLLQMLLPFERYSQDLIIDTQGLDTDQITAQASALTAGRALTALVICGPVETAAAVLKALPGEAPVLLLGAPQNTLESHRLCGYAKSAHGQLSRPVSYLGVAAGVLATTGRHTQAAGRAAVHLLFGSCFEADGRVTPAGLFVVRLVQAKGLPPVSASLRHKLPPCILSQFRAQQRQAAALTSGVHEGAEPWCLVVQKPGQLSSLGYAKLPAVKSLQPWEVQIKVAGIALNFR